MSAAGPSSPRCIVVRRPRRRADANSGPNAARSTPTSPPSPPMPTSTSRSHAAASSTSSAAASAPAGLCTSTITRPTMPWSVSASRSPAASPVQIVSNEHAVAHHERRRAHHLAVAHPRRSGDRHRLVGDAVDVVGGAQAPADEVEHAQEVGEVAVVVQLGRVVDAEVDRRGGGPARRPSTPAPRPRCGRAARPSASPARGRRSAGSLVAVEQHGGDPVGDGVELRAALHLGGARAGEVDRR